MRACNPFIQPRWEVKHQIKRNCILNHRVSDLMFQRETFHMAIDKLATSETRGFPDMSWYCFTLRIKSERVLSELINPSVEISD
jgi:hypothetical protein